MKERKVGRFTLGKHERLCGKRQTDALFSEGSRSLSAYPLRVVYRPWPGVAAGHVSILVSVSKRRFKRAVCRNRVKRQVREAYRLHKGILEEALRVGGEGIPEEGIMMAFLWLSDELCPSSVVENKVKNLLHRVAESYGFPKKQAE